MQPQLLRETCLPPGYAPENIFVGADLNLYYDTHHPQWYKRPDWFLVLGIEAAQRQADLRWSYVIWQEGLCRFWRSSCCRRAPRPKIWGKPYERSNSRLLRDLRVNGVPGDQVSTSLNLQ
jgi:hypothetical protein